ncbi:MAG: cobalt-precorrin-5B (C(1))-methyltransferase CbiD [Nitrospirota bacterium]
MKKKSLRSGYTTGACAAAAAKAAALLLLDENMRLEKSAVGARSSSPSLNEKNVEIPFPDGSRVKFKVHSSEFRDNLAIASIIKDAGDDPDVTNGAEILAEARIIQAADVRAIHELPLQCVIKGGNGVGTVTKPGLSVPVGEPAINPVPRQMIKEAVMEAMHSCRGILQYAPTVEIMISVPDGEELAKKTLNYRLGIKGGISILGTTGIVKPVSTEAWTATITSSMDVARAMGHEEIVLSAGRSSERAHMKEIGLPDEAYVLMGDYLEYSLQEAGKHEFKKIHLCAQWAKMVKIAMATPQTHVRFGAIDTGKAVEFLNSIGISVPQKKEFNTAREIYDYILSKHGVGAIHVGIDPFRELPLRKVCNEAVKYAQTVAGGIPVIVYLVSYDGKIIM